MSWKVWQWAGSGSASDWWNQQSDSSVWMLTEQMWWLLTWSWTVYRWILEFVQNFKFLDVHLKNESCSVPRHRLHWQQQQHCLALAARLCNSSPKASDSLIHQVCTANTTAHVGEHCMSYSWTTHTCTFIFTLCTFLYSYIQLTWRVPKNHTWGYHMTTKVRTIFKNIHAAGDTYIYKLQYFNKWCWKLCSVWWGQDLFTSH